MANNQEALYNIRDFRFTYPESNHTIAWQGNHLIREGERILLTGASGSGKSTLLYGLMGLIPEILYGKVDGDIYFRGKSIIENPEFVKGRAGLILQNPSAQILCHSVREELAYGLENKKIAPGKILEEIDEWANKFGISPLLNQRTSSLSGGEKQKITLLSILMTKPEILMLDEPTAFLDPISAKEIMEIIEKYDSGKTMLFVEHNLGYLKGQITRNLDLDITGKVNNRSAEEIIWHTPLPFLEKTAKGRMLMQLENIRFSYPEKDILKGVNLKIYEAEIIGIKGRNGSGKSTLLQIMAGLKRKYGGDILLDENAYKGKEYKYLNSIVGLLFQDPENHFLFHKVEKELEGCDLQFIGDEFEGKKNQSPFTLSEGEKRRLSTAISYQGNKKLLFLDEPTFGQDINNKRKLISFLGKLRDRGLGIVIVSHDEEFLKVVCGSVYELKEGKLQVVEQ
ncbi:MAG: ABC transporter ATP-binding protein [Candidatus Stygibacter australis]|nr:ABC transporter ATP-binding protein [Candidatus Stygibacter australis]